jgi:hypothetical protein
MRLVSFSCAVLAVLAASVWTAPGLASESFSDWNATDVTLKVNRIGEALVTYRRADDTIERVLVWDAVNARHPDPDAPQVRFRYDYAGGWGKYRNARYWKRFKNSCRRYDGPPLVHLVTACRAPDGSYWALQRWQRRQALLGFPPFRPEHTAWELHVSHWTGPLAELEVHVNWTYGGAWEGVFGRLTYLGVPVYGFGTTPLGNPKDRYVRNVYIDTFDSGYGPGWWREAGIVTHQRTGTFCHSFVPQKGFPHYPSQELRPPPRGERYRVTVMGPGVTPVIQWEGAGLGTYDPGRDHEVNRVFDEVMSGDAICAHER